jgi:hypothetical protein
VIFAEDCRDQPSVSKRFVTGAVLGGACASNKQEKKETNSARRRRFFMERSFKKQIECGSLCPKRGPLSDPSRDRAIVITRFIDTFQ